LQVRQQQAQRLRALAAEPLAQQAPDWQRQAEQRELRLVLEAVVSPPEQALAPRPGARSQRASREQPVSEQPPLEAALPPAPREARSASARVPQELQPDASVPPSPLHPSRLCPP
jgi:hypothetical protein